jgi:hypothetical protein
MPRAEAEYKAFEQQIRQYFDKEQAQLPQKSRDEKVNAWIRRLRKAQEAKDYGKGLGALAVDINGDGKPDLYVANDTVDKFLYINRSRPGHILLEEFGLESGTARDYQGAMNGSMGLAAADYDHCGRPSLWVTNYEHELHGLYHNDWVGSKAYFNYSTQAAGISAIGQNYVGWGTGFLDLYHNGWESIFVSNGHAIRHPTGKAGRAQLPVLLQNTGPDKDGKIKYKDITPQGGSYFTTTHCGRGAALGDLDNDGRIDIALCHLCQPVAILRNEADTGGNHWLGVELIGTNHRDVVGSKIALQVGGVTQYRFTVGGGSYQSTSDRRHVFGLGKANEVGRVTVTWPDGKEQSWDGLGIDRYWRLVQGQKEAQKPPQPKQ